MKIKSQLIIHWFLKAKAWKLFMLLYGLPAFVTIVFVLISIYYSDVRIIRLVIPISGFISTITLSGWLFSIGIGLADLLPAPEKLPSKLFKASFLPPLFFVLFISIHMISHMCTSTDDRLMSKAFFLDFDSPMIIIPIVAMASILYALLFAAKTIRSVELGRKPKLGENGSEDFLLWIYPIGLWFLQPKINRMAMRLKLNTDDELPTKRDK